MDELVDIISNFDEFAFKEDMELHHNEMGNLEDGHATQRVCSLIAGLCEEKCNEKYKVGYTQGVYDMFHIGHLNLINNAKSIVII